MKNLGEVRRQQQLARERKKYNYETKNQSTNQTIDRETRENVERVVAEWKQDALKNYSAA